MPYKKAKISPAEFRYERELMHISRQKMADDFGLSIRTIEFWEWGVRPIPKFAENLLKCLKLARMIKERGLGPPK